MNIRISLARVNSQRLMTLLIALLCTVPGIARAGTVSIDWSAPSTGQTTFRTFGTNDSRCGHLDTGPNDPKMAEKMKEIGFHFLRLHAGTTEEWTTNKAWDPAIIKQVLNAPYVKACGDDNILITVDIVPPWCRNIDNTIKVDKFAAFCADLVKITNKDLGRHIKYWEVQNEQMHHGEFENNYPFYFKLHNACAEAMKAVDPTIKVGGPTLDWWDPIAADQFLTNCWTNVDFLSWHEYPAGDDMNPPLDGPGIYKAVMQKLPKLGQEVTNAKELVAAHRAHGFTDGHPIPVYYGEYNMNWNWVATGWGQDKYVGAAYFGGALTELAHANVDWAGNWSAKDDYFGLIDMNDKLRPPAYVYMFANHYLIGSMAQSSSDDPDVYCLAVDRGPSAQDDKHAIMLTNTFYNTKTVNLEHGLTAFGLIAHITTVDKTGVHTNTRYIGSTNSTFVMPGFSVAMITMP